MSDNIKVYQMNDCEWWASKWDIHKTNEYYLKDVGMDAGDNPEEEVEECDIDKKGMWWETHDKKDREELGDYDEISSANGHEFGSLMRQGNEIYKLISFREAIAKNGDFENPYCIASTEF